MALLYTAAHSSCAPLASTASRLTFRDDSAYAPLAEVGQPQREVFRGRSASARGLRQSNTTGNLRMTDMRDLLSRPTKAQAADRGISGKRLIRPRSYSRKGWVIFAVGVAWTGSGALFLQGIEKSLCRNHLACAKRFMIASVRIKGDTMATQMSKSQLVERIATSTELSKRDVKNVMDTLTDVGHKELKKAGVFLLPGFAKFVVVKKPATKARKGVNPFTGEEMMFKAKPARKIVRARPVKAAKDAV
jgi:DNA-binding protein HU-beta